MAEKVSLVTKILHCTSDQEENYAREILLGRPHQGGGGDL
jgi:hypothetical protein